MTSPGLVAVGFPPPFASQQTVEPMRLQRLRADAVHWRATGSTGCAAAPTGTVMAFHARLETALGSWQEHVIEALTDRAHYSDLK